MKIRMALVVAAALGLASLAGVEPAQPVTPAGINCPPPPGAHADSLCVDGLPLCGTYNTPPCPAAAVIGILPDGPPPIVDD